jgi:hypothetical protein
MAVVEYLAFFLTNSLQTSLPVHKFDFEQVLQDLAQTVIILFAKLLRDGYRSKRRHILN